MNNVLNGPLMTTENDSKVVMDIPVKIVKQTMGAFVNGKPHGKLTIRSYETGAPGLMLGVMYHENGTSTTLVDTYEKGVIVEHASMVEDKKSGVAKIYESSMVEHTFGEYTNNKRTGTLQNAIVVEDGIEV